MRRFKYQDLDGEHTVTEAEILQQYEPYWRSQFAKRGLTPGTPEECIEDFCVVNWAWEVKEEAA